MKTKYARVRSAAAGKLPHLPNNVIAVQASVARGDAISYEAGKLKKTIA